MPQRAIAIIATLILGASPASAQTMLAWKFVKDDAFAVEQHIVQSTALNIKNKPFQQKSTLTLRTRWQVTSVDRDNATLKVAVESMTSNATTGDAKTPVPSKDDELWRGSEFTLTVDAQGRLRDLKGHVELLKKLAGDNPQRLKVLTALKPAESFQALFQDVLGPLPAKPVAPGDRWQHSAIDTMSVFGSFVHTTEFNYRGEGRVESVTKTSYKAPRYAIENDVFRITKGEVKADDGKADDGKGEFIFDVAKGRMQRFRKSVNVRGDVTLETLSGLQRVEFTSGTELRIDVKK